MSRGDDRPARAALLDKAIDAYLKGFEADWRDAYPGVNAVTLMEVKDPPDPRRDTLLPVVAIPWPDGSRAATPDYWDHATRSSSPCSQRDETAASALADALARCASRGSPRRPPTTSA